MRIDHFSFDHSDLEWVAHACGKAKQMGVGKWVCLCPAHDDRTPSLSVSLGRKGQILFYCHAGCGYDNIMAALRPDVRNLVNVKQNGRGSGYPLYNNNYKKNNSKYPIECIATLRTDNCDKSDNTLANTGNTALQNLIKSAKPIIASPVETYLNKRLGGVFPHITDAVTPVISYLPSHWHVENQQCWPVMLAPILNGERIIGLHRTYLDADGNKAPVSPVKKVMGKLSGGYTPFGEVGNILILAEGIETALSLYVMFQTPVWAALSANNMANIALPSLPLAQVVYIAEDNDSAGRQAARRAADKFWREGRRVVLMNPPDRVNDFNDYLTGGNPYEQYRHRFC